MDKVDPVNKTKPKKIAIIGLPGSGKSTFAYKLGQALEVPVHHLDKHMFQSNGNKTDKQEFIEAQKKILSQDAWIIEGCSSSTFEMRFAAADVFIYLHFSRLVCFYRIFKRMFKYEKDFGALRVINWGIVEYTWNFDKDKRSKIEDLAKKYPRTKFIILTNQQEAENYFNFLKTS